MKPGVKKTLPVSLLMEGKRCLIVGGGPGVARKLDNLLPSGAEILIVSPGLCDGLRELYDKGLIFWEERRFEVEDLEKTDLVYAGTSDSDLNRRVLEECRRRRILCCPIDSNWREGDFTTPAVFRQEELSIAVSTGGASCRRSKLIKQNLARHIEMVDSLGLLVIGTSHRHLDLERREPFHLGPDSYDAAGLMLSQIWGVHEFLILNTCNRVEIHAVVSEVPSISLLLKRIIGFDSLREEEYYLLEGEAAFEHTSAMMAGLYSQTPGENHIVAQMKEAYRTAEERGWTGTILNDWFSRSLGIAKKIRNRVSPLLKEFEIEDVACENIRQFFDNINEQDHSSPAGTRGTALILGTGIIAEGMARRLDAAGYRVVCAFHRNRPSWAGEQDIELIPLKDFRSRIPDTNVIIAATSSPEPLLGPEDEELFTEDRETLLIDLSLPRNISPGLGEGYPGKSECRDEEDSDSFRAKIAVRDLDDLKHWYRRELADMDLIMTECRSTIQENRNSYERIANSLAGGKQKQPAGHCAGGLRP